MRCGLGPFAGEQAGSISWMEAYEIMGEAARQADSTGFDSVWVAERQFSADFVSRYINSQIANCQ